MTTRYELNNFMGSDEDEPDGVWGYLRKRTSRRGASRLIVLGRVPLPPSLAQAEFTSDHDSISKTKAPQTRSGHQPTEVDYDYRGHVIGCDVECDTFIKEEAVSNHHCVLFPIRKDGRIIVILQDLSKTGTSVNGQHVGFLNTRRVVAGDIISITPTIQFILDETSDPPCPFTAKYSPVASSEHGQHGTVLVCRSRSTGRKFAAQVEEISSDKKWEDTVNLIPLRLRHPNILSIHEVFNEHHQTISILEHTTGCKLSEYLWEKGKLTEMNTRKIFRQLFAAVGFLHSHGVVHRNIQPDSITVFESTGMTLERFFKSDSSEICIKLGSFSFATYISPIETLTECCGTLSYAAPEMIWGSPYGKPVDVWSLGVVFYYCLHGRVPFPPERNPIPLPKSSDRFEYSWSLRNGASDAARNLFEAMTTVDAGKRFTIEQCLAHPWLAAEADKPGYDTFIQQKRLEPIVVNESRPWEAMSEPSSPTEQQQQSEISGAKKNQEEDIGKRAARRLRDWDQSMDTRKPRRLRKNRRTTKRHSPLLYAARRSLHLFERRYRTEERTTGRGRMALRPEARDAREEKPGLGITALAVAALGIAVISTAGVDEPEELVKKGKSLVRKPIQVINTASMDEPEELAKKGKSIVRKRIAVGGDDVVPDEVRDDMQLEQPAADVSCWTFTPGDSTCEYKMPLEVDGHPVVIPVGHYLPLIAIPSPPPDPHPRHISTVDRLPDSTVSEILKTFPEAVGFYLLINGQLQVIMPEEFDYETSHSRLPTEFGGLRVSFIAESFFPTAGRPRSSATASSPTELRNPDPNVTETIDVAPTASESRGQTLTNLPIRTTNFQRSRSYQWLTANFKNHYGSTVRAVVENGKSKDLFEGKIGVLVTPVAPLAAQGREIQATVPTHVFASACKTKRTSSTQALDWTGSVRVLSTSRSIELGMWHKVFDPCPRSFPVGFTSDISLVEIPMRIKRKIPRPIERVSPTMKWLDQGGWMNIKYNSSNLALLDGEAREGKSIGIVDSRCQMVGQGIFRTQRRAKRRSFFWSSRTTNTQDELRTWTNLVARSILYRVRQDVHVRGGQSGTPVCLMEDATGENTPPVAKVAGFASFVQMASDVQRYDMEGDKLYKRLQEGRVAFYGAFQVPEELRDGYHIV